MVAAPHNGENPATNGATPVPDVVVNQEGDDLPVPISHGLTSEGVETLTSLPADALSFWLFCVSKKEN
jgi:hypothetical protein